MSAWTRRMGCCYEGNACAGPIAEVADGDGSLWVATEPVAGGEPEAMGDDEADAAGPIGETSTGICLGVLGAAWGRDTGDDKAVLRWLAATAAGPNHRGWR